jgi:hypothetical protein
MARNAGYSPRLFSLLGDHIIDDGGVNIVKLYNTSYTTRSVKPVFIAINDDSLHHIKLFVTGSIFSCSLIEVDKTYL